MKLRRWIPLLALAAVPATAAQPPTIELPADAGEIVVEYDVVHHMLADRDPRPLLRIFADGRVRVHYPVYMAKAGDYEARLPRLELAELLADLAADGLLDFDVDAARTQRAAAEEAERRAGDLHHVSDVSETVIEVRVASYRPAGAATPIPDYHRSVRWPNVYTDARRFRGVAGIQTLASAEARLRSIMERADLARVQ